MRALDGIFSGRWAQRFFALEESSEVQRTRITDCMAFTGNVATA
jgi:hypothetical protein